MLLNISKIINLFNNFIAGSWGNKLSSSKGNTRGRGKKRLSLLASSRKREGSTVYPEEENRVR